MHECGKWTWFQELSGCLNRTERDRPYIIKLFFLLNDVITIFLSIAACLAVGLMIVSMSSLVLVSTNKCPKNSGPFSEKSPGVAANADKLLFCHVNCFVYHKCLKLYRGNSNTTFGLSDY